MKETIMPIQPIKDGRFVPNRIVDKLLETSPMDLNSIAMLDFSIQERIQFAQLIGYSLGGFGELSYVDDDSYEAADKMSHGMSEADARIEALTEELNSLRTRVKEAAKDLFNIHEDDLQV